MTITPSSFSSIGPNEAASLQITFDTSNVDTMDCPPAQYDADFFAAVSGQVLGGATIRFDWSGTPP